MKAIKKPRFPEAIQSKDKVFTAPARHNSAPGPVPNGTGARD